MNTIEIWSNVNGWHWLIDSAVCRLESAKVARTAIGAETDARKCAARFGFKRVRVEVSRAYDDCVKRGEAYYAWQPASKVPAGATDAERC